MARLFFFGHLLLVVVDAYGLTYGTIFVVVVVVVSVVLGEGFYFIFYCIFCNNYFLRRFLYVQIFKQYIELYRTWCYS